MPTTFQDLRNLAVRTAWPMGMPARMDDIYGDDGTTVTQFGPTSNQVTECLVDLQNHSDFLKENHEDVHPFCSTLFQCGATVIDAPRASQINLVYTQPKGSFCCPVTLTYAPDFNDWQRRLKSISPKWDAPPNTDLPELPNGFFFNQASAAVDTTDKGRRWGYGYWTLHNGRIYIGPRVESWEDVWVRWNGVKYSFNSGDIIPVNGPFSVELPDRAMELISVIVPHVKKYEFNYVRPDANLAASMIAQHREARRQYIVSRDREMAVAEQPLLTHATFVAPLSTSAFPLHCQPAAAPTDEFKYAIFGNVLRGTFAEAVGSIVASWTPDWVVVAGNMWGKPTDANNLAALDTNFGVYYYKFLSPYLGTAGSQTALAQQLYPAIGAYDRLPDSRFNVTRNYFNLPSTVPSNRLPSRGYYEKMLGPAHFFFIDSGYNVAGTSVVQADGNTATSAQGAYFQQRIQGSRAVWKFVVISNPPYSSSAGLPTAGGFTDLQWPFKTWGIDAVFSAGMAANYERLAVDGLPFVNVGTGGMPLTGFTTILDDSLAHIEDYGSSRLTLTCRKAVMDFYQSDGTLFDTLTINK